MRKIVCIISILFTLPVIGQQTTQYSQWIFNQFALNPALAGVKNCVDIRTAVRTQWFGLEGAPISGLLTFNAPLTKNNDLDFFHGIGGKIERDAFGPFTNFSVNLAYALHFRVGSTRTNSRLSFGVSAGAQQFVFDHSKALTIDPDPAVAQSANQMLYPLIGFGGWYYSDFFYVGASIDQLARTKWHDVGFSSRFRLHTKVQAGGKYTLKNNMSIVPGILFRIPPAGPFSIDINSMFDYKNVFMVGLGYRNTDAFISYFKVNIKQFTVGYSFDFITSKIRGGNFHTHEFSIQYSGCFRGTPAQSACPLFQ